jgi:hypothetical protein
VDILAPVDQEAQGLHEELNGKTEETQLGLQVVMISFCKWTKSIHGKFSTEWTQRRASIKNPTSGFHKHRVKYMQQRLW